MFLWSIVLNTITRFRGRLEDLIKRLFGLMRIVYENKLVQVAYENRYDLSMELLLA